MKTLSLAGQSSVRMRSGALRFERRVERAGGQGYVLERLVLQEKWFDYNDRDKTWWEDVPIVEAGDESAE